MTTDVSMDEKKLREWTVGEKLLAQWGGFYYKAKIIHKWEANDEQAEPIYRIHFEGWAARHDANVRQSETDLWKEFTDADFEAAQKELDAVKAAKKKKSSSSRRMSSANVTANSSVLDVSTSSDAVMEEKTEPKKESLTVKVAAKELASTSDIDMDAFQHGHKLVIPDILPEMLTQIMMDDFDKVSKLGQLSSLPADIPISEIFGEYIEEAFKLPNGEKEVEILEVVAKSIGSKKILTTKFEMVSFAVTLEELFDRVFKAQLLYGNEKEQYALLEKRYAISRQENDYLEPFKASRVFGLVHLLRFLAKGEELNKSLDESDHFKIAKHLQDFIKFLDENVGSYYKEDYDAPDNVYPKITNWRPN